MDGLPTLRCRPLLRRCQLRKARPALRHAGKAVAARRRGGRRLATPEGLELMQAARPEMR